MNGRFCPCLAPWGADCLGYQYILYAANYGCSYAAAAAGANRIAAVNETVPMSSLIQDRSPSETAAGVVIKTGTARPAPKVRRAADLWLAT